MRHLIVHYHIFKNAGSTFDAMLEATFGSRWANHDKTQAAAFITPEELAEYIQAHTHLDALSSHHAVLPLPEMEDVEITPVLFLRHPLDRIRSVYDFERKQGQELGPVSKGAEQASKLTLAEYIRWRLDSTANGVVHNFQTVRLIHHPRFNRFPITDAEFDLAIARLHALPFFGLVEDFDRSIERFSLMLKAKGIEFASAYESRNQSKRESALEGRLERMRDGIGEQLWCELERRNDRDLALYAEAVNFYQNRDLLKMKLDSDDLEDSLSLTVIDKNLIQKKIHLFIGPYKTGSTSAQNFFSVASQSDPEVDFYYPNTFQKKNAHHELYWRAEEDELYEALEAECQITDKKNIVLSSEHLSILTPKNIFNLKSRLERISKDIVIYVVMRSPDKVYLSHWADRITYGETDDFNVFSYRRSVDGSFSLAKILRKWAIFSEKKLIIYQEGGDIISLLLSAAGLNIGIQDKNHKARKSIGVATGLAVQILLRRTLVDLPDFDTDEVRSYLAKRIIRICAAYDKTPNISRLPIPSDLISLFHKTLNLDKAAINLHGWDQLEIEGAGKEPRLTSSPDTWYEISDQFQDEAIALTDRVLNDAAFLKEVVTSPWVGSKVSAGNLSPLRRYEKFKSKYDDQASGGIGFVGGVGSPILNKFRVIPKTILQYWDTVDIPNDVKVMLDSWAQHNPEYNHIVFNKKTAMDYINSKKNILFSAAFLKAWHPAMESDLFRLFYIFYEGGIYCDADHQSLCGFDGVIDLECDVFLVRRANGMLVNGIFAAKKRSLFIAEALRIAISSTFADRLRGNIWEITGPGIFNRLFREYNSDANRWGEVSIDKWERLRGLLHIIKNDASYKDKHWSKLIC